MSLVITLLILLLIVIIAYVIIDRISLPSDVAWVVKLIMGVLFLIVLLDLVFGIGGGFTHNLRLK